MHDLNYFPDGYQDAAEITLPEVWMNWLSMRNRLHALLFSDRITLKSPGRAHRNASGNNIQTIKDTNRKLSSGHKMPDMDRAGAWEMS